MTVDCSTLLRLYKNMLGNKILLCSEHLVFIVEWSRQEDPTVN